MSVCLVALAVGLTGCVEEGAPGPETPVYRKVTTSRIVPGDVIPEPQGAVVLTITGAMGPAAGGDGTLELDMQTLEALGLVEMRVDDQIAEGGVVVFQGVLLRTLLDVAQVDPSVSVLRMFALNDYVVEVPVTDATAYPVLIATRADGERLSIEHYGPIRIVYPFGLLPLNQAVHEPRSIWHLYLIRAE